MNKDNLYKQAVQAAKKAYAPYSGFSVGAALLCEDGTVFTGCNIENASYSATVCAERVALFSAVSEGHRNFSAIAIAGSNNDDFTSPCPPCGVCRQALSEFCTGDMPLILADGKGGIAEYRLDELFPLCFNSNNMEN